MSFTIDEATIKKYDENLPRYTSYPTAPHFSDGFEESDYIKHAIKSNQELLPNSLSLYVHIPFCHSLCYFCGCNKVVAQTDSPKVERYLDALMREIRARAPLFDSDRLVQQIHFGGGTPNFLSNRQLAEILEEIARCFHFDLPSRLEIGIEIDPRYISPEDVKELSDIGFNRFSIGVQDLSESVQSAVNRVQDPQKTLSVIEAACAVGESTNVDLITGLPNQTIDSVLASVNLLASVGVTRIAAYGFAYLPERIKAQRLIDTKQIPAGSARLKLARTLSDALVSNGYKHIGLDHYMLTQDSLYAAFENGGLQRNFQGYTTHAQTDLIGLGVSAISSFNDAFAQNNATISGYIESINSGRLPIVKGLSLGLDDQLRSEVIQQIMCRGELDLSLNVDAFVPELSETPIGQYFKQELDSLQGFQDDDILTISSDRIQLTEKGRYFMCQVASKFDAYLSGSRSRSKNIHQFSRAI